MAVTVFLFVTDLRYGMFPGNTAGKIILVGRSVFLIPAVLTLTCMYIFLYRPNSGIPSGTMQKMLCGAGLIAYLTSNVFIYIFRKYLPDELADDLERSGEIFD